MKQTTKTVEQVYYQCENCGKLHDKETDIVKCPICGKEVCSACEKDTFQFVKDSNLHYIGRESSDSLYEGAGLFTYKQHIGQEIHGICSVCAISKQVEQLQIAYDAEMYKLVDEFNNKVVKLNEQYNVRLKGL